MLPEIFLLIIKYVEIKKNLVKVASNTAPCMKWF